MKPDIQELLWLHVKAGQEAKRLSNEADAAEKAGDRKNARHLRAQALEILEKRKAIEDHYR